MHHFFDFTRPQLIAILADHGFATVHALRLWRYVYRESTFDFTAMSELPKRLRDFLLVDVSIALPAIVRQSQSDEGGTQKFALGLKDGRSIETVSMRYRDRTTVCVSSQVGCAVGCIFCATGQAGFTRNLTVGEIVAQAMFVQNQLLNAADSLESPSLRNIVVMGMGEPLLNYDAVMNALKIFSDSAGLAVASKRITLSTVGVVPGILRLAAERRPYSLAVSLHATTQAERAALIPSARAWPLDDLIDACRYYAAKVGRKIFFEWTLIDGVNDSVDQAEALANLIRGIPAQVNLIPLNPTTGYDGAPSNPRGLDRFRAALQVRKVPVSIRQRRGIEIAGGCGQLAGIDGHQTISIASP